MTNQTKILKAYDDIATKTGSILVTLYDVKAATKLSDADFKAAVNDLRRARKLSLDGSDGRHVRLPKEVMAAGFVEEGHTLVYMKRR